MVLRSAGEGWKLGVLNLCKMESNAVVWEIVAIEIANWLTDEKDALSDVTVVMIVSQNCCKLGCIIYIAGN